MAGYLKTREHTADSRRPPRHRILCKLSPNAMNHKRNIKEMLSIPAGSRNVVTSGYSSFTDSQFFCGSQFWPENSQGTSQDMSLSSRTSQQSSQEGSDPKFLTSYQTKPLLFGELKDKSKAVGMLDKFEEDKKKAKEKTESDMLAKECHHIRETLNNVQQLVAGTERNTAVCQTVLEKIDSFALTLQNNLQSLQSDISQHFVTLLNKVSSLKEMMSELEKRVQKSEDSTAELDSNQQSLKSSLECLREEQEGKQNLFEKTLKLLSILVSEHPAKPNPDGMMDSAIQTSPGLENPFSNTLQENKLEDSQLTCISQNLEHSQAKVPPSTSSSSKGKKKFALKGHKGRKKRPLVLSQRSKHTVTDENSQPLIKCNKRQNVSAPLCERHDQNTSQDSLNTDCLVLPKREVRSIAAGCYITPLNCWSQDSNSSVCLSGIEPILEKLTAESRTVTPAKAQGLWELFDDCNSD